MPTEKELVDQLRRFYEGSNTLQKDLAGSLGLSPQQLAEILATRNRPTAAQVLRIQEFLKDKPMNSIRVDPPKLPATARDHSNEPRTLFQAKEQLENLRLQLAEAKAAGVASPARPASAPATPAAKPKVADASPTFPAVTTPGAERLSPTPMPINYPAPEKKTLPASANTPFLISEILKITSFEDCLALLSNPAHTPLQRSLIFSEIKTRRAIAG